MSENIDWSRGFWAGVAAILTGVFVAVLVFLHLRPRPSPAQTAALPLDALPTAERKAVGFHATMKTPQTRGDSAKE